MSCVYGLSGKEFTENDANSVYMNAKSKNPLQKFTVGINDDLSKHSLIN